MLSLNIKVPNVEVEQQSDINVFYKVFVPNKEGRFVPTLIRNSGNLKAKDKFVRMINISREMILQVTGQIDNNWVQLAPQSTLTFTDTPSKEDVTEIVRQVMSQIVQDGDRDLYTRISIDLIAANDDELIDL